MKPGPRASARGLSFRILASKLTAATWRCWTGWRGCLELLLELISGILIVGLTAVVVYAVVWRYVGGASPRWYDEIASIMLVWLTYYAGALAALKRGHIGVDGVLLMLPQTLRMAAAVLPKSW
jgi:TRAP-type C4-dicarboxylate transport system permease small subunit